MVFVIEKKPGLWYVVESYRKPGCEHPFHRYLGPAESYPGGMAMVRQKQVAMAERKKHDPKKLHYTEEDQQGESFK